MIQHNAVSAKFIAVYYDAHATAPGLYLIEHYWKDISEFTSLFLVHNKTAK